MEQIIVSGLIFGCIYGLVALGLVLIYRTTGLVNFAHGEITMVSTFVSFTLFSTYELNIYLSILGAMIFSGAFGALIYYFLIRFVNSATHLNQLVLTLGIFLIVHGAAGLVWGHTPKSFPRIVEGPAINIGNVFFTPYDIFIVVATFVLALLLFALFKFTKIGLAMRASSQDLIAAKLMGIRVDTVFMVTWAAGCMLGGVAGMLTAPFTFVSVNMMFNILIMAFAAAVLAGFMSLPGAVVGGLIIGVFGNLVSYYWAPEMSLVSTFVLIVIVLYVRPQGIFGGVQAVKKV